ncbi:hypothetical protein CDAR_180961 [Caerostris darwini]|uniref:Uncharacterized protein n=1 Tax=Caerostris darwini TaxID=1538125 RepID=A0AAV4TVC3_9ARAC|nr:hypothetical protein CDAR_180961 [Caerostris darwini]
MVFLRNCIFQLRPRHSIRSNFQSVPENNAATSTAEYIYDDRSQLLSIPPHHDGSNYPASCGVPPQPYFPTQTKKFHSQELPISPGDRE